MVTDYSKNQNRCAVKILPFSPFAQHFLILMSLIVASYLVSTATPKDESEVLYLTFDDFQPKDFSPKKHPSPTLTSHAR